MGRLVDVDLLVTTTEIADRLHLRAYGDVHYISRKRSSFPEPVLISGGRKFWYWPDVEAWVATHPMPRKYTSKKTD